MMTVLSSGSITRQVTAAVRDAGERPLIVTLTPTHLILKPKGLRRGVVKLDLASLYNREAWKDAPKPCTDRRTRR